MGAVDFIVDTLDEEISRVLIKRIHRLLPSHVEEKIKPALSEQKSPKPPDDQVNAVLPVQVETLDHKRISPRLTVPLEISRGGVLWMPGQVTQISKQGLMIETSLLGKLGMLLHIRIQMHDGKHVVLTGHINHISMSQHSSSANIGVEISPSAEWTETCYYIGKQMAMENHSAATVPTATEKAAGDGETPPADPQVQRHVYVDPQADDTGDSEGDRTLEIKFYRSLIGKQVGNYRAVSFIGAGSMAGVFKGWDTVLERDVALKVISYKLSAIPAYREMFIKEARMVSRLIHPNIAQIYHIDQIEDVFYFVMELISGGTLADVIKDRNKLNMAKCLEHMITTCRTLDFVNKQNIVHRDIKPANIMINDKGILKIVDFGIAVFDDESNRMKKPEAFGSPLYMSPEAITGRLLDSLSDIYSLGATFYHVFAGVPPFDGESDEAIMNKHLNEQMVPLRKRNPMASVDLSDIIEKMMAKKPQERYQNYRAVMNDLMEVVH